GRALRGVRVGPAELGVVAGIDEARIPVQVLVGLAAVAAERDPAVPGAHVLAGVQHHRAVGALGDLVLVHLGAHGRAHGPGLAVIVRVHRVGRDVLPAGVIAEPAGVLLDQAPLVLPVAQLDAGAGG